MAERRPWGRTFAPREWRVALGGLAVAALVLGYVYGVEPLLGARQATRTQLEAARLRASQSQQLLARRARLEQDAKDLEGRRAALTERLLRGPTPALAAAELQEIVKGEARQANLVVQRLAVERPATTDRITEVAVRLMLKGELRPVTVFVRQLEQHRLALSIPELALQVQDPKNPQDLIVDLVVAGYLVAAEETPPTGRPATAATATEGPPR